MSDTDRLSRTNNDVGRSECGHSKNPMNVDSESSIGLISEPNSIEQEVYLAAENGRTHIVQELLRNKAKCEVRKILATKTVTHITDTLTTVTATPFIIASKSYSNETVRWLLNNFIDELDLEQTGTVRFYDGYYELMFKGASALYCAARAGNLEIVEMLLESGADVNHPTLTNCTPLLAACRINQMDIVTLLIRNNANLDAANIDGNTALHVSAKRGHIEVVEALINAGASKLTNIANLNAADNDGNTALHVSAERGHIKVVEALINAGASKLKNNEGMTFLHLAVLARHDNIILFYVDHSTCSRLDRIESYELLGAAWGNRDNFCCNRDNLCQFYVCMWRAMKERCNSSAPGGVLEKKEMQPVEAYENRIESRNFEKLLAIKDDHDAIRMESLIVFERLLGEDNLAVQQAISMRAAFFHNSSRFGRGTLLRKRAMHLKQKNGHSIKEDLRYFVEVFSSMIENDEYVKFTLAEDVFDHCLKEIARDQERLKALNMHSNNQTIEDRYELSGINYTALYLLSFMITILESDKKEEEFRLCCLVYRLNKLDLSLFSMQGSTLLHMVCDENTHVYSGFDGPVIEFPNVLLLELLLKCGADPSQLDKNGNTALHILCHTNITIPWSLRRIITKLVDYGVHIDCANRNGVTVSKEVETTAGIRHINLQCLAARVVKKHNIPYVGQVPPLVCKFIEMH